jgi:hypothetical protein
MLIQEVEGMDNGKLAALASFLMNRAKDANVDKTFPLDSFVKLANQMGVAVDLESVRDLSQRPPLNNLISNVTDSEVVFKGADVAQAGVKPMGVDQAQATVDRMAKRAASKKGL